jgi:hypothetical protein
MVSIVALRAFEALEFMGVVTASDVVRIEKTEVPAGAEVR